MIDKKIAIFLAIILAIPNIAFACATVIVYNLTLWFLIAVLIIFSVIVAIKSIIKRRVYRGKLNVVLLVMLFLIITLYFINLVIDYC